jgi:hypothetical protein
MQPFNFLNSINQTKDPLCEKDYNAFLTNRGLSYFSDTIFLANQMNKFPNLGKKLQFDFLRLSIRPRKRFSKWFKDEADDRIIALKTLYGYSHHKAKQAVSLISEQDWEAIFALLDTGGTNTKIPK